MYVCKYIRGMVYAVCIGMYSKLCETVVGETVVYHVMCDRVIRQTDEWMDGWLDCWVGGWMVWRMKGWIDRNKEKNSEIFVSKYAMTLTVTIIKQ
jgi:hypothetical protein